MRLTCVVLLGTPRPRVTWYKMGEVVTSDGHVTVEEDGTLVVRNVEVKHEGEYTCVASNVGGNATFITKLDVQGEFGYYLPMKLPEGYMRWGKVLHRTMKYFCIVFPLFQHPLPGFASDAYF